MWHFELSNQTIYATNTYLEDTLWSETEVWGIYIGGRWTLDYTWKLMFNISNEDWNNRCSNIKTDKEFYEFCEWLGVRYRSNDGKIYHNGKEV